MHLQFALMYQSAWSTIECAVRKRQHPFSQCKSPTHPRHIHMHFAKNEQVSAFDRKQQRAADSIYMRIVDASL